MSQVSLSQLDYSAIGFSKTMTEEFDDLKKGQEALKMRVDGIKQWYTTLKEGGGVESKSSRRKFRGGKGRCVASIDSN